LKGTCANRINTLIPYNHNRGFETTKSVPLETPQTACALNLHDPKSQQFPGSRTLHICSPPQSHSSPFSTTPFPHKRSSGWCRSKQCMSCTVFTEDFICWTLHGEYKKLFGWSASRPNLVIMKSPSLPTLCWQFSSSC
jgi:hypothetical protein